MKMGLSTSRFIFEGYVEAVARQMTEAAAPVSATPGEVANFSHYLICRARGISHTRITIRMVEV